MKEYPLEERVIGHVLHDAAGRHGDRPYVFFDEAVYTYADAERLSNQLAAGLRKLGVKRGEPVAIMMANCPEYLWVVFALGKLGALGVPLNTGLKGALLGYQLADSGCQRVIADAEFVGVLEEGSGRPLEIVVREAADTGGGSHGKAISLCEVLAAGTGLEDTPPDTVVDFCDPWLIMYTSGTTGPSRGVLCPHAHPQTVGYRVVQYFGIGPADRMYTFLPLFHGNALWYSALAALWGGASIALVRRFSASRFWADIRRYQATEFNAIMSVAAILEKVVPVPEEQDNSLRLAFVVPLPVNRRELEERWGLQMVSNYGMTELPPVTMLTPGEGYSQGDTSGRPIEGVEIDIVDDKDRALPPGTVGEVVVRPTEPWTSFIEYHGKPETTAAAFRNAWFHTGDRGMLDEEGHFHFVDRKKDAIRRRGENISAHEIEQILRGHPGITDVAAVGVPSELGEEEVAVYVVRGTDELTEATVVEYAREELASYMVPRYVAFVQSLPKTGSEKVEKYKVKERALAEYRNLWDRERAR